MKKLPVDISDYSQIINGDYYYIDKTLHAAFNSKYYEKSISFIRILLTSALKDNIFLEKGILTGILRAAKEGIFSGLNNLEVHTILDKQFSDKFGFTLDEVDQLMIDQKLTKKRSLIRDWYNGYRCGKTEPEKSYHLFILGLFVLLTDHYEIKSNRESGYGRYDMILIPYNINKLGIIIEFKKVPLKEKSLSNSATK